MRSINPSLIQEIKKECNSLGLVVYHHYKKRNNDYRHRKLVIDYARELESKRELLSFILGVK